MKTIGTILLCVSLPFLAISQIKFLVEATGLPDGHILVEKPINGNFFPVEPEKIYPDHKGKFAIELPDDKPGFLRIHLGRGRSVRVFAEKGKPGSLSVDLNDFDNSLRFDGPTADQNKFLHELNRKTVWPPVSESLTARSGENEEKKPKDFYLDALDNIEAEKKILHKKGKKKFSSEFIRAMEQDIVYYHTCLFSEMVAKDYQAHAQNQPSRFNSMWAYYWGKIFEAQPIAQASNAGSEYYVAALDYYINDYRLGYLKEAIYEDPDLSIGEQYLEFDRLFWEKFKDQALEYGLAAVLSQRALLGNNETVLFDLFQKFKNDFPNSIYLSAFEKAVAHIGESLEEKPFAFPQGIVQLDAEVEINSVEDIMRRFKGKVVYLDIWATWCSPCLFEFRQKKPLEDFAQGKEIALVFISVDNDDRKEKWQKTIVDNNLHGYHLLANYALRDELINKFGDGSNLALPHYIIYDKQGNLADANAKQPSNHTVLFKDLSKWLGYSNP